MKKRAKCESGTKITDFLKRQRAYNKQNEVQSRLSHHLPKKQTCLFRERNPVTAVFRSQLRDRLPSTWTWQRYLSSLQLVGYIEALENPSTHTFDRSYITDIKFDHIGELFATSCSNGTIEVFNFDSFLVQLMQHRNESHSALMRQLEDIEAQRIELQSKTFESLKHCATFRENTDTICSSPSKCVPFHTNCDLNVIIQEDNKIALRPSMSQETHEEHSLTKQKNSDTRLSSNEVPSKSKKRKFEAIDLTATPNSEGNSNNAAFLSSIREGLQIKNVHNLSYTTKSLLTRPNNETVVEKNLTENEKFRDSSHQTPTTKRVTSEPSEDTSDSISLLHNLFPTKEKLKEYEMKRQLLEKKESEIKEKLLAEGPQSAVLYETPYKPSAICWNVCNAQQFLVAFANFGQIFVYDVEYDEPRKMKFETVAGGWGGSVNDITFLKDSKSFVGGGRDGILRLWDVSVSREAQLILSGNRSINSLEICPSLSCRVYAATEDAQILCWDIRKPSSPQQTVNVASYTSNIATNYSPLCSFKMHPSSEEILYLDFFYECVVVDLLNSVILFRHVCPDSNVLWPITSIKKTRSVLLPTSQFCMGTPKGLTLFDIPPYGKHRFCHTVTTEAPLTALAWHPKFDFIVTANLTRSLELIGM
jgi:WD40 repeat protein